MVHDTSTLIIDIQPIALAGIDGFGGEPARSMELYLETQGNWVHCDPSTVGHYKCTLQDGTDLAKAALVNGAARTIPAASRDYVVQEENARTNRRGIWRDGADIVAAIPAGDGGHPNLDVARGSYVYGVTYAGPAGVPDAFLATQPEDGLGWIEGQPFTLDTGVPVPLAYDPALGWGFWDHSFVWRRAPDQWRRRLGEWHPQGAGLREVDPGRHGFAMPRTFFRGPAVEASLLPGHAPIPITRSPYAPAAFVFHRPELRPAPVMAGPGEFARPGRPFEPGPGPFRPGGPGHPGMPPIGGLPPARFGDGLPGFHAAPGEMRPPLPGHSFAVNGMPPGFHPPTPSRPAPVAIIRPAMPAFVAPAPSVAALSTGRFVAGGQPGIPATMIGRPLFAAPGRPGGIPMPVMVARPAMPMPTPAPRPAPTPAPQPAPVKRR